MVSFFTTVTTIAMALTATAAPAAAPAPAPQDVQATGSHWGSMSYFYPGLGACGQWSGNNDYIVAVGAGLFDRERPCGRRLRVYGPNGRSADVTVVDRCVGCGENDLDLSPAGFQAAIGSLDIGRTNASWDWI
ncbi:hypothetical protein PT974_02057 [Cladobotryum mycophilum]|uniref:RlpA-like protein double-psi beta-barrel domain-containing protein n=1 Tax=Cladobotryum mycophilum TaxID=491253 RepID=A0ABR0SX47_9HYPO